ncbi:hypothetical protein HKBW3S25_00208 [Candidatus Hakubella thermalkaliphila]|uniref:Uncharacterized protein n=2 Tax=Candidatus Hakubella thermalkaliphila TaxID=2754717 RepID=A0A6V8NZY9_9ACTN|nr:hypothetical protein HKBW3S25_00208 [Candidatus Hakubella thermalkaliphila]
MPEETLRVSGYRDNKVRVEVTEIRGEGGPVYPQIAVPLEFVLSAAEERSGEIMFYDFLQVSGSLFLQNPAVKIGDSKSEFSPYRVLSSNQSYTYRLEIPLTQYRIERIEEARRGDIQLRLDIDTSVALYNKPLRLTIQIGEPISEGFVTGFKRARCSLNFAIPQSHWIDKVLPGLGYGKTRIIEIPLPEKAFPEIFPQALDELSHAQRYFNEGDYDKTVAHCRNAIEPVKKELEKFREQIASDTEYEWVKTLAEETFNWLDKLYKKTRDLTSKSHHIPSVGHFSRHEAESIILVTTALLNYVGNL